MSSGNVRYVAVRAVTDVDGTVIPKCILWDDGRRFPIERVLEARPARSTKAGGPGTRYLIRVGKRTTYLYFDGTRWYVEPKRAV